MKKQIITFLIFFGIFTTTSSQVALHKDLSTIEYNNPTEYIIGGITVSGTKYLDQKTLINISGLEIGEKIVVPGEGVSMAIKKLWKQGLFADIKLSATKIQGNSIFLDFYLQEHPRLSKFKFIGKLKKSEITAIKEKLKLMKGKVLTQNVVNNSKQKIRAYFIEKGFLNIEVSAEQNTDSTLVNSAILAFTIDKRKKVKITEIKFIGLKERDAEKKNIFGKKQPYIIAESKLKRTMKDTKEKKWYRIFKASKFLANAYEEDKKSIIAKYNEKGFRDARIVTDTNYMNADNSLTIELNIHEGEPFYFRQITWVGNQKYNNEELDNFLGIESGRIFDQSVLDAKLFGNPNGTDISSKYLDDGYLFFNITPVEIATDNDSIDLEVRIYEGKQARLSKVTVSGNSKTNDHVVMREIRTKPGDLFNRSNIIRSQRELAQLGYFDPEKLNVDIDPDPIKHTVDVNYIVAEKPSDQINLQGGWGAGRVVGSLGLVFNNFSASNIFKKNAWAPLPSGDGQKLSLTASSNGIYYQNYNISFTEPWLGGKKPTSLSVSLYKSVSSNGQTGDDRESIEIKGTTIGLGKRLTFPDDYFTLFQNINFQQYKLNNSQSFFSYTNGYSNNMSYGITLGRSSVDQPTFPRKGSNFALSLKITPPYSLFDEVDDYSNLDDQEKYKWIEYYKWKWKSTWYTAFTDKLVLGTRIEMGLLGTYNNSLGISPFERYYVGGDGMTGYGRIMDGRELVALRGYSNNSLSPQTGGTIYNKYTTELRYAVSLNPTSTVYVLGFLEAGDSWNNFDAFSPFGVKRSAGFGVRIMLPMFGLMGLDYGWGFDDVPGNPDAGGGQFHFSIGQQF
ncbi:MAG: POTRA domain-containing protein [Bacteroidota bacterium]|nr:POTRA domain-containing protein [Bacteroidota bacterium]